MHKMLMTGRAERKSDIFDFGLGPWCDGIGLMVRDAGAGNGAFNGAGIWPSVDKAKSIAHEIAKRAIGSDCSRVWTDVAE
jgi:hypothetical protein